MTSGQGLLAFIVSAKKTGVILIGLILYITLLFSYYYNTLSLFIAFGVLNIIDRRNFFSSPVGSLGKFSSINLLKILMAF